MTRTRATQLTAIVLTLTAGFLWSQRLGEQAFQASRAALDDSTAIREQLEIIEQKTDTNANTLELVEFGRKFLAAGNPRFAIIPLERATQLKDNFRDAWYLLGYSYAQLSQETSGTTEKRTVIMKALAALEQARQLDPLHQPTNDLISQLSR